MIRWENPKRLVLPNGRTFYAVINKELLLEEEDDVDLGDRAGEHLNLSSKKD